ncbi:MAG: hypothetical protein Cons2KO_34400 [Congregibacter sp.]
MSASKSILHTLNKPVDSAVAERLLDELDRSDAVLLLGQAVTLSGQGPEALAPWLQCGAKLYALIEDVQAYGVEAKCDAVELVDYAGWVTLSERYALHRHWR